MVVWQFPLTPSLAHLVYIVQLNYLGLRLGETWWVQPAVPPDEWRNSVQDERLGVRCQGGEPDQWSRSHHVVWTRGNQSGLQSLQSLTDKIINHPC